MWDSDTENINTAQKILTLVPVSGVAAARGPRLVSRGSADNLRSPAPFVLFVMLVSAEAILPHL